MVDPKRAAKLIREHFAQLTPEQFIENLKRACPEVFEEENNQSLSRSKSFVLSCDRHDSTEQAKMGHKESILTPDESTSMNK